MGTGTGSGMRNVFQGFWVLILASGYHQFANAGASGSVVFATGGNLIADVALTCERPADDAIIVQTDVHPIWQVDLATVDLGYIDDDYTAVDDLNASFSQTSIEPDLSIPDGSMGVQLDNGWSLGLSYELLDARFKVGPFLLPDPDGPVFEGPKFVATLKFR